MPKNKKTLLKTSFAILSLFLIGCPKEKPDAFLCTFVIKDPFETSYNFCGNLKTQEVIRIPLLEMGQCIKSKLPCKWITTDQDEFEKIREYYKDPKTNQYEFLNAEDN